MNRYCPEFDDNNVNDINDLFISFNKNFMNKIGNLFKKYLLLPGCKYDNFMNHEVNSNNNVFKFISKNPKKIVYFDNEINRLIEQKKTMYYQIVYNFVNILNN